MLWETSSGLQYYLLTSSLVHIIQKLVMVPYVVCSVTVQGAGLFW